MKIKQIQVKNYRLLKDFKLDLEDELSLVLGKNNSGKTSILSVLDKFINSEKSKFTSEDFNLVFKNELKTLVEDPYQKTEEEFKKIGKDIGIKLRLVIEYFEKDDLSNICNVMMNLDTDNNFVVLGFDFVINYDRYIKLRKDYFEFKRKEKEKFDKGKIKSIEKTEKTEETEETEEIKSTYIERSFNDFFKQNFTEYFKLFKSPLEWDNTKKCIIESTVVGNENFKDIISFKFIKAKRDVNNKETDKTLSRQTSEIYKKEETSDEQKEKIEKFTDELSSTDNTLSGIYAELFKGVIDDVKKFGGLKAEETNIEIFSTLQQRELLEGNTTVMYTHENNDKLPEHHNGLGYMNLISLIFEIKIQVKEFKRSKLERPSDINLLFIEEPEAHTHPQMQYVFIKNIKDLLKDGIKKKLKNDEGNDIIISRELQYIVSTHSSHIVAESKFDDIKYLKKLNKNQVISKNLKDLEKEYIENGEDQNYRFLKQYLTLNRAELFFTDKAIFIEGDTERILLPAIMKKLDNEYTENKLLSQNISIVEVGAYSQIFEKFIDFIGMKSLIITDIDSCYLAPVMEKDKITPKLKDGLPLLKNKKCPASDENAKRTTNNSLLFFHRKSLEDLKYFIELKQDWKILRKNRQKKWNPNRKGNLLIVYQTEELDNHAKSYHARSFEDAFFHINYDFITNEENSFQSLTDKWLKKFKANNDSFELADNGVGSKPSLAIEILMNSKTDDNDNEFSNWQIPAYIKEGLLWLKED
ncbi:AAA family ATPase [Flavobacterium jejuense]|uniref:AAA family ATPase n=1 Tax=Flavobacterium jejuense TaxID=1544455 RepID=A0ABX0IPH6_9FLAO|nr:ATP-dependent endonuclease [Flavobacterium jejuense]NHN25732.1 AAA family ATPase [Flavobacterium jejuense]